MFWRKKEPAEEPYKGVVDPEQKPKTVEQSMQDAARDFAEALNAYSEAAYNAALPGPDADLQSAYERIALARELVLDGRLAYALGRCIPEHVEHWPSWIQRDDFQQWVGFKAENLNAHGYEVKGDHSEHNKVAEIQFTFNGSDYRFLLRNKGSAGSFGDPQWLGEIELHSNGECVAKFEIHQDLTNEYNHWEFTDVMALKVGDWMKDILDISAQIDAHETQRHNSFSDERALAAARHIQLD